MVVMAMEGMAATEDMVMGAIVEGTMAKDLLTQNLKQMLMHTMVAMAIEDMEVTMEDTVDMVVMGEATTMVKHKTTLL